MTEEEYVCCICTKKGKGFGNNPFPMVEVDDYKSRCCDLCNDQIVLPMRFLVRETNNPIEARLKVKRFIVLNDR